MPDSLRLNYWKESWPLQPDVCPCDLDFCNFIYESQIRDKVIFHFGTGEHHVVARQNIALPAPNYIIGVTASRPEYDAYIDFIVENPLASNYYKVIFTDIYTLSLRLLPQFQVVTLFHLYEFFSEQNSAYAPLDDTRLVDLFISKLEPNGRVLFYSGSFASEKMLVIVQEFVRAGKLVFEKAHKTLLVYRVARSSNAA